MNLAFPRLDLLSPFPLSFQTVLPNHFINFICSSASTRFVSQHHHQDPDHPNHHSLNPNPNSTLSLSPATLGPRIRRSNIIKQTLQRLLLRTNHRLPRRRNGAVPVRANDGIPVVPQDGQGKLGGGGCCFCSSMDVLAMAGSALAFRDEKGKRGVKGEKLKGKPYHK